LDQLVGSYFGKKAAPLGLVFEDFVHGPHRNLILASEPLQTPRFSVLPPQIAQFNVSPDGFQGGGTVPFYEFDVKHIVYFSQSRDPIGEVKVVSVNAFQSVLLRFQKINQFRQVSAQSFVAGRFFVAQFFLDKQVPE
jgi:hypothetical protein